MNRTFRNTVLPMLLLLFLLLPSGARSQSRDAVTITGTVRDASTSRPVGSVNVMLQDTSRRLMYGYVITGDDGAYRLEYRGEADTLVVAVTGFNIKPQARRVAARTLCWRGWHSACWRLCRYRPRGTRESIAFRWMPRHGASRMPTARGQTPLPASLRSIRGLTLPAQRARQCGRCRMA